jgi:putative ABC transport system permease protein
MDFDLDELLSSGVGSYNFEWLLTFLKGMIKPLAATAVVLVAVILSYMQNLGLGGEMVYSIVRAFLQLSVIGFVLQFIFSQDHAVWIILAYIFMVCINLFLFLFLINIFNLQVLYMLAW